MGAGDITPDEGQAVASILEAKRKAIETVDLEARLSAVEPAMVTGASGAGVYASG